MLVRFKYYIIFIKGFVSLDHTAQVCLLLKHKANQYLRDRDNVEPLEVAIKKANANIVTLYVFM